MDEDDEGEKPQQPKERKRKLNVLTELRAEQNSHRCRHIIVGYDCDQHLPNILYVSVHMCACVLAVLVPLRQPWQN